MKLRFCAKIPRAQDVAFLVFRETTLLQIFPILPGETGAQICRLTGAFRLQCFPFRRLRSFLQQRHAEQYGHLDRTIIIGSICPGISQTVPDFCILSLVPEGHTICPGSGPDIYTLARTHSASYHQLLGCVSLDSDSAYNLF